MRERVRKMFFAWDFEEEEAWLNHMARQGKALVAFGFGYYDFEPTQPGEYTIRMEMLPHWPNHPESQEYIRFVEETGAEHIGNMKNWVCFRKKTADGSFDLFSDRESRLKYVKRFIPLLIMCCLAILVGMVPNLIVGLKYGFWLNLLVGLGGIAFGAFLVKGLLKIIQKKQKLENEGNLFE